MEFELAVSGLAALAFGYLVFRGKRAKQFAYIENYRFHPTLAEKVKAKYPHLSDDEVTMVFDALRDYFRMCNLAKKRMVSMPSQVVDVAWHEFILFTRLYKKFSEKAIGRFLHHTPTVAMKRPTLAQDGIKRAWRLACAKERIDPADPARLPLIFAIDGMLDIKDGFRYSLDCKDKSSPAYGDGYCAGHIGCAAGCAGDSGTSDSGGFFDGSGDSSGCSGSSCGGGCGGS
jgi:hypothetical protein